MIYQWKQPRYGVEAQVAGEELERIGEKHSAITAEAVVDESRPKTAVLHGCFDWNDETAAEKYRETQARCIIGNIVTVSIDGEQSVEPVRAFVHIQNEYKPMPVVLSVCEYRAEMIETAIRELRSFQEKYSALKQLSGVFSEITKLEGTT